MSQVQDPALIIPASITLLLSIGFLYSSIKFPKLLKTSTKFVKILLYVSGGVSALNAVLALLFGMYGVDLIMPIVIVMIVWYLLLNVRRLEEEHGIK